MDVRILFLRRQASEGLDEEVLKDSEVETNLEYYDVSAKTGKMLIITLSLSCFSYCHVSFGLLFQNLTKLKNLFGTILC